MEVPDNTGKRNRFTILMVTIALANFMAALDSSIVTVALPTISKIFNILPGTASLVITVYILVMAGCVLIFGKISDVIGFKRMFLSGFLIFTLGSVVCGFLPALLNSFSAFVVSRIFQAIGATMITAIGPGMVAAYIPIEMRGKAMGTIFTMAALGMAIGPTIGGILTQYLSWSWIFFINIPIGLLAILCGKMVIPETASKPWKLGFDRLGSVLIFVGLSSLLFVFSKGQAFGWTNPIILGSVVLALLTLGGFVWYELTVPDPLLEIRLFTRKNFLLTTVLVVLVNFIMAGIMYLVPFYLQYVKEHTPSIVGIIYTSLSIGLMIGGILGGVLYHKVGGRTINIVSWVPIFFGYLLLSSVQTAMSDWFVVLSLLLIGFGSGSIITSGSNMIINSVSKQYQGMVSSLINLLRFFPITMGVAFFNIIFMQGIPSTGIRNGGTIDSIAGITIPDLTLGFDHAFLCTFMISIIIVLFAFFARQEVHPDYQQTVRDESQAL
ncbi:MFS transporter [Methanospirillum sp.]|uniref:MFS transporter n=1 Tax=Methanospirillum sp. TaxID=45200 RepID=UPI0026055EE5|nr:MFS transporter [Methanospirillum sp.]